MIKTNRRRQYGVYVVLIGIILLLTGLKLKYGDGKSEDGGEKMVTVRPTAILPTPTMVAATVNLSKDYPVWQKLPYTGDGFIVDRYVAPLTLAVKIKSGGKATTLEKEVIKWLEGLGEGQESHKIVWE